MSNYRIEFKGDYQVDVPLTIMNMERHCLSHKDFRVIKLQAFGLAREVTDGYCRATVYRNGMRCFRYTVILDELEQGNHVNTQIWSAWPGENYRTMRKVTFKEEQQ